MIPREVERMGEGADVLRGSRELADRRPAEVRDPRALDPRVLTPAEQRYARRCARLQDPFGGEQ